MLYTASTVVSLDLATLLRNRQNLAQKRISGKDGNPCPEPEKPFPCKGSSTCIPMAYVCDDNYDCEDGYDENMEMCTAAHRPPVEDIMHFLDSEKDWLIPSMFGGKSVGKVAHGLAVSQTIDDFRRRVGLSPKEMRGLKNAMKAVKSGDEEAMEHFGMPPSAWNEVIFFFSKLIKSGFDS